MKVNCKVCKATYVNKKLLKKGICHACTVDKATEKEMKAYRKRGRKKYDYWSNDKLGVNRDKKWFPKNPKPERWVRCWCGVVFYPQDKKQKHHSVTCAVEFRKGKKDKWSRNYDRCVYCKTTNNPHNGLGYCKTCYTSKWLKKIAKI